MTILNMLPVLAGNISWWYYLVALFISIRHANWWYSLDSIRTFDSLQDSGYPNVISKFHSKIWINKIAIVLMGTAHTYNLITNKHEQKLLHLNCFSINHASKCTMQAYWFFYHNRAIKLTPETWAHANLNYRLPKPPLKNTMKKSMYILIEARKEKTSL
jgi:hypothetical protein